MELLSVYNNNGNKTKRIVERENKDNKFSQDEHIGLSIIFIENNNNEFLIQKTSLEKGGLYSSTGGHILYNENPIDTIIRETKEELGINISNDDIINLGYLIFDFPIRFFFYLKKDINLDEIIIQKEEVESVSYMSIEEINNIINNNLMNQGHAKIFKKILEYKKMN